MVWMDYVMFFLFAVIGSLVTGIVMAAIYHNNTKELHWLRKQLRAYNDYFQLLDHQGMMVDRKAEAYILDKINDMKPGEMFTGSMVWDRDTETWIDESIVPQEGSGE